MPWNPDYIPMKFPSSSKKKTKKFTRYSHQIISKSPLVSVKSHEFPCSARPGTEHLQGVADTHGRRRGIPIRGDTVGPWWAMVGDGGSWEVRIIPGFKDSIPTYHGIMGNKSHWIHYQWVNGIINGWIHYQLIYLSIIYGIILSLKDNLSFIEMRCDKPIYDIIMG